MFDHSKCDHPRTKTARAACRRAHEATAGDNAGTTSASVPRPRQGGRLPSVIAPKLRPVIDRAKQLGLTVSVHHDPPEGVEQMFVIKPKGKRAETCSLIAEAFASARKGTEGKAEFFHVEDDRSRQLSKARAIADLEQLAKQPAKG